MWIQRLDGVPVPRGSDAACLSDVSGAVFMGYMPLCTGKYLSGSNNADLMETWLISGLPEKLRYCEVFPAFEEQGRRSHALTRVHVMLEM